MGEPKKGEKGVLKLVHPGRHVEIHRKPISAAEVMSKNPRHCVTRPDFFKFPYIVVRPESVLYPGQVFYIVPNSTVHKLLDSKPKTRKNNTPRINQSPKFTLDSAYHNTSRENQSPKLSDDLARSDRRNCRSSYLEAWPMMGKNRSSYLEYRKSIGEDSKAEDISVSRNENNHNKSSKVAAVGSCHEQNNGIKSCLKKGSSRTSRYQRVTFASPIVTRFE